MMLCICIITRAGWADRDDAAVFDDDVADHDAAGGIHRDDGAAGDDDAAHVRSF
jgi:hypothetical protein